MSIESMKNIIIKKLQDLDKEVYTYIDTNQRLRLVIVGGSALVLLSVIIRPTDDIDAIDASYELQEFLSDYGINMKVLSYESFFPYNYSDRLVKIFEGLCIDCYTASLEDIIIAKLHSARPKDKRDVTNPSVLNAIDWCILERLALADDELKLSTLNDFRYNEFLDTYNDYVRRYRPCEN